MLIFEDSDKKLAACNPSGAWILQVAPKFAKKKIGPPWQVTSR
jgi:hypothetical protein